MKRAVLLLLVILLFVVSCEIKKPVFPEWDVNLRVPLMSRSFFVSDLVDSVNIVLGDDDVLVLRGTGMAYTQQDVQVHYTPQINVANIPLISGIDQPLSMPISDAQNRVELWYGVISSGAVKARFSNVNPQLQQAKLTFNDIRRPDGSVFEIAFDGNTEWVSHSLVGCRIGNEDLSAEFTQMNVNLTVQSGLPNGSNVGTLDLRFNERFHLSELHGLLHNFDIPVLENAGTIDISYPENVENTIRLMEAKLKLNIQNEVGFACEIQGTMRAERTDTGQVVIVPLVDDDGNSLTIPPSDENGPGEGEFIIENGIGEMMQIMPNKVSLLNMKYVVRNDLMDGIGSLRHTDRVLANYQVDVPFTMILFDSYLKLKEPIELTIDQDNRRLFDDRIERADLQFLVLNKLPLGCDMQMLFSMQPEVDHTDPSTYLMKKQVTLHSYQWVQNNPDHPSVNSNGEQLISLGLSQNEVSIFSNPKLYLNLVFTMEATDGPITIKGSPADYVRVKSMINAVVHVSEDL